MDSGENSKLLKENVEGSNGSIPNYGSSAEYLTASACSADYFTASCSSEAKGKNDTPELTQSSPAVLKPSSSQSDGRPKSIFGKHFLRSGPKPSAKEVAISSSTDSSSYESEQQSSGEYQNMIEQEVSTSSSSDSHNREDEPLLNRENRTHQQQTDEPNSNCWRNFVNRYMKCVRAIDHSCFVGIFQLSVVMVCISTIIIGIVFFRSCEGKFRSLSPFLDIVMGIFGLFLSYMWIAKVCREDRGQRFWNHDKNRLILFLALALFFMTLEFVVFNQMTPVVNLQSSKVEAKCPKTYYDYLYYMHMVNGGFLALASLLYLPAFCVYVYNYRRMEPSPQNGHFQPL